MAQQTINVGTVANDGTGDTHRTAFQKANSNFDELYGVASTLGPRNAANGYVGIDANGNVMGTFASRRDTLANIAAITLAAGELAFTTDTKDVYLGDGVTQGGIWIYGQPIPFAFRGENITITDPTLAVLVENLSVGDYTYEITADFKHSEAGTSNFGLLFSTSDWLLNPGQPEPQGFAGDSKSTHFARAVWSDGTITLGDNGTFNMPNVSQSLPGRGTAPLVNVEMNAAAVQVVGGFRLNSGALNLIEFPTGMTPFSFGISHFKRNVFGADQPGVNVVIMGSLRRVG